ncbi:MAG: type II toxin-antitoxin system MqsA family antitoxin [Nitrospirae bacterium]|nr:type II toxin-antitoxin system MqsA family antitoxin [Candidatus Troglogloeales bacterium]MBI3598199.1 type II toxin-antitoxin system MqsA family antitoxin [Candidatus Troglogloeales bacterium]
MFRCHVCGHCATKPEFMNELFTVEGQCVMVEHIPSQVCERCGEATFSRETTERIRKLVHGGGQPLKTVPLNVFELV